MPVFREIPKGNIRIGNRVAIGKGVVFEITPTGTLLLEDNVVIGDYNRISSQGSIHFHPGSATAEHVSIRGSFHHTAKGIPIMAQESITLPIVLQREVSILAQSVVLMGADIPQGVIIAAHSVVRKSDKLHSYGIFAGAPLKHIRDRE